jgi:phage shock protein PspC (stress-responsive transcriptional regulator)
MTDEQNRDKPEPDEAPKAPESAPPQVVPVQPRRLTRRPEGKIIGGVCTGLAAFLGVDPVLVRVGFVLATVLGGGAGVIAYVVMWLVMPMAPEGEPYPDVARVDWFDASSAWRWTAIGLIVLAAVILSHNIWHFHGGLVWGLLLLGVGIALWSREFRGRNGHTPPPPRSDATAPLVSPPAPPVPEPPITGGSGITTPMRPISPPPVPRVRERREPSMLGRLVVGAVALAIGALVLLGNLNVLHLTPRIVFATVLGIVGLGLLTGSWWGRARWLVFPGIVLALMLSGVALLPANIRGGAGDIEYAPIAIDDVRTSYHHGAGNMRLDLSQVKFDAMPRTIRVTQGFGNLEIDLPKDVPVQAQAHVRGGNLEVLGHDSHGWDITDAEYSGGDAKLGLLTIRTDVGFGNTRIQRGNASGGSSGRVNVDIGPRHVRVIAP